jgi:hypothetical protein
VLRRLRIAICVNQENDASLLCGIIKKLRPEGEVDVFYIAHEFLATQYNDVKYDIAIIEIEKKEIHGFDIAITMKTRRASTAPHIILYSDTEEYVYEGYKVACRYLRKTDTIAQIEDVLADIMEMCKPKCIFIETSEGAINIAIDAIQFIEAQCLKCEVASGCPFCQGFNYDEAETPTNFSRATYICKMHKARVRANNYYFARLFNKKGIRKKPSNKRTKRLYFLLSDSYVDYCEYQNQIQKATKVMTHEEVLAGLEFAHQHFYSPIFVHPKDVFLGDRNWGLDEHHILHLVPARFYAQAKSVLNDFIPVFCFEDVEKHSVGDSMETVMLNISASEISNLAQSVEKLLAFADRVHLNTFGLGEDFDLAAYEAQLNIISNCLAEHKDKEFNVISDYEGLVEHNNCKAGSESFAFAPGGNLFVCPGFYSNGHTPIGDPNNGITHHPNGHLFEDAYRPICERCDAHQCVGCSYTALLRTNEVNIPAALQCEKATIERNIAADFLNKLHGFPMIQQTSYSDPIERFIAETNAVQGYYRHNTK